MIPPVLPREIEERANPTSATLAEIEADLRRIQQLNELYKAQELRENGEGKSTGVDANDARNNGEASAAKRRKILVDPDSSDHEHEFAEDPSITLQNMNNALRRLKRQRSFLRRLKALEEASSAKRTRPKALHKYTNYSSDPPPRSWPSVTDEENRRIFNLEGLPLRRVKSDIDILPYEPADPQHHPHSPRAGPSGLSLSASTSLPAKNTRATSSSALFEPAQMQSPFPFPVHAIPNPSGSASRRPPLPSATPSSAAGPSRTPPLASSSQASSPLPSPGLASYRAPEELKDARGRPRGHHPIVWDDDNTEFLKEDEMETEYRHYWGNSPDSGVGGVDGDLDVDEDIDEHGDEGGEGQGHRDDETDGARWSDEEMHEEEEDEMEHFDVQEDEPMGDDGPAPEENDAAQGAEGRPPDMNDELEANIEDDMDGALEGKESIMFCS